MGGFGPLFADEGAAEEGLESRTSADTSVWGGAIVEGEEAEDVGEDFGGEARHRDGVGMKVRLDDDDELNVELKD